MNISEQRTPVEVLEVMLGHLGFAFEIEEEFRESGHVLHIRTRTPARLIGRDGKTLNEIQYLVNKIISIQNPDVERVVVDVENYRMREQRELLKRIEHMVHKVKSTGKTVQLPPLNSFDRRLVHQTYKDDPDIETISPKTDERLKRMTLKLKEGVEPSGNLIPPQEEDEGDEDAFGEEED